MGSSRDAVADQPSQLTGESDIDMAQNDTKKRDKAALLVAEDRYSDEKIAADIGIGRRTLARWKKDEAFSARVREIAADYSQRVFKQGLARRERRLAVLNDLHDKMLQVIAERADSPDLANLPGGKTGLVTKTLKGIGKGDDFQVVEQYEVDTATVREIRALQEQVATELGQLVSRTETVDLTRLFEKMSPAELDAYAREGSLPKWFPSRSQMEAYSA